MNNTQCLHEIEQAFSGVVPLVFSIMAEKEVLSTYWPWVKNGLFDETGISDPRITQGIMVVLSSRCHNSYCFVAHSYFLLRFGFGIDAIRTLVDELMFPPEVEDSEKWSLVLKWSLLFYGPQAERATPAAESHRLMRRLLTDDEYRHLFKICTVIDMLNRFSEFYSESIQVEDDKTLFNGSPTLRLEIPSLVKFYTQLSLSQNGVANPVVTICMYCKNIEDVEHNWHALESAIQALERNSIFSHGICPDCRDRKIGAVA